LAVQGRQLAVRRTAGAAVDERPPVSRPRLSDDELIERARRGDTAAFARLVERHETIVYRVSYLVTGNAEDAQEATQDAFVNAYRALPRFRRGAPLRPWLVAIARNAARTRRDAARRHAHLPLALVETREGEGSAEHAAFSSEERRRLLDAIEELPERERAAVTCRHLLGLSERETAAALGVRTGTVKSRTSRGLARLREAFDVNG
jgi:RNA polymerase sigma-70 factor (ECF subfamily)